MSSYWSGLIPAAVVAATAALGAQGQNPANSPPADAGAPAGVQRTAPSPSAQTRTDTVTISGCLQNAPMTSAAAAGADRGSTGGNADASSTRGAGNASGNAAAGSTSGNTAANSGNATTTGASASGRQFVLNSATMTATGQPTSGAVGTSGTSATSYMLQGDSAVLTPHLNHRVEITGTVQSSSASTTGAANARTGSTASGPTLRVDSVKMLAATCDAAPGTTTTPSGNTPQPQR